MTVALIGHGAIGQALSEIFTRQCGAGFVLGALTRKGASGSVRAFGTLSELLEARPRLVIECAGQEALRAYASDIMESGVSLVPASIGALADRSFCERLISAGRRGGSSLLVSPGAVAGLDGLRSARLVGLSEVLYRGISPSPPDCPVLTECGLIFRGYAREAALRFPTRANVTAAIALAGIGFDKTRVELFFDTSLTEAQHHIEAKGAFGELRMTMRAHLLPGKRASWAAAGSLASTALRTLQLTASGGGILS